MSKQIKLPTILLVTENPAVRSWIKKHLDEDFFIIYAEHQYEAIDALNSRLDFIIVDSSLANADALEICKELSKITHKNLIPIFLITGRLKKSYRNKAQSCGVTDFISDQLDFDELQVRIQSGQKMASAKEKTADLSLSIKAPKIGSSTDSLKGKFVLNDQGLRLLAEAKKNNTPVALLVLRLDQFNEIKEPNNLLSELGEFLQHLLREKDALIPSTEGKFIILLSNTTLDAAQKIAERLREKTQIQPFAKPQKLTVSIAVSSAHANEKGFNNMIDTAVKSFKAHSETNLIISLDQETP